MSHNESHREGEPQFLRRFELLSQKAIRVFNLTSVTGPKKTKILYFSNNYHFRLFSDSFEYIFCRFFSFPV